jgi:nitrogen fixation protein FixH
MMARTWTGRDILMTLIATFGIIIGVNAYFIVLAERTYPGEDVADPYLQGLDYNDTLKDRARQAALGWSGTIGGALTHGSATITVTLLDRAGKPVTGEALTGLLRHPMNEEHDHLFALKEIAAGKYVGAVSGVAAGSWDVVVTRKSAKEAPFETERRLWLR